MTMLTELITDKISAAVLAIKSEKYSLKKTYDEYLNSSAAKSLMLAKSDGT